MKKITHALFILLLLHQYTIAQERPGTDSSTTLNEVIITAFEQNRVINSGTIVKVISNSNADRYNKSSLVSAFNTIAGVRMEERSPGSYRINMRGSSLRSPFGVRNVKVYWNDIPITDAGGNTYFNQFAYNNFSSIELFKGPAGSMYGAGTGGLLLMHSFDNAWKPSVSLEYITGSYGLQNIFTSVGFGEKNSQSLLTYAHNQSDGYRNHSSSKRDNVSFVSRYKISGRQQLTAAVLYDNLFYETPGGLTKAEYLANPKQARPAAGSFPSADASKAAIYQQNFTAGLNHAYNFTAAFKNSTSVYGSFAQVKNPTFRNYERRNEPGFGGRTSFIYDKKLKDADLKIVAGGEWQAAYFNTQVSKNKNGNPDTLQTNDDIQYMAYSLFTQADISIRDNWIITAGVSINRSEVNFTRLNLYPVTKQGRTYKSEFSPRISVQKRIKSNHTVFASVSKGFSPPTISELLPSTGVISTFLEAEKGINYEMGGRVSLLKNKLRIEATGFYFKLDNALVTRKDSSNADYYVNAGDTRQKGMEISADYSTAFSRSSMLEQIGIKTAWSLNDFKYGDFKKGKTDFSGKRLPSVPGNTLSVMGDVRFKQGFYLNCTYYYASKIFLDDANAVAADPYHLVGCRAGWKPAAISKVKLNIYSGVDNLLDETYSLGNDINAAAGRYYNAAPKRNFYVGVSVQWNYSKKN
ncbi:MAG: TonB-dependent receptor [Ferruginibacter sp.]|nr:TonB-dependent receptor [Ferruginibacter sp.]